MLWRKANPPPVYFLHIAKTAGMSLNSFLEQQFPKESIAPFRLTHELAAALQTNPRCLEGYALIRGHLGASPLLLLKTPPRTITLLREPVARTLSHAQHILRSPDHWLHALLPKPPRSVEELLGQPLARQLFMNFQARNLAQDFDLTSPLKAPDGSALPKNLGRLLASIPPSLPDDALLKRAQERLRSFAFVGRTENLAEALARLSALFGWPAPARTPKENAAPQKKVNEVLISSDLREEIACITKLDAILYSAITSQ
jgi:hypothetical protein